LKLDLTTLPLHCTAREQICFCTPFLLQYIGGSGKEVPYGHKNLRSQVAVKSQLIAT
jgi:hypothetical protein